jgi:hypothetical protein
MTRSQFFTKQKGILLKSGKIPVKAIYDKAGNCIICGECGRCPGWHTVEDAQRGEEAFRFNLCAYEF